MVIILVVATSIMALIALFSLHKLSQNKILLNLTIIDNNKLNEKIVLLEADNIELIKLNERNSAQLKSQELAKEEAMQNSKAILFDLSQSVSKQLIDLHKKETQESREISNKTINQNTVLFNSELQKVQDLLTTLYKDIGESKNTVDQIKQSLLSPSQSGQLAEITLENILKNSGLRKDLDFQMQYSFSSEEGKLRPDAIVFLPEDNLILIDAKSSQFLLNNGDDDSKLLKSATIHIKQLSSKDYSSELANSFTKQGKSFTRVITLMFMPTEQAVERVTKLDESILTKAWQSNIYLVGPIGLMNMLSLAKVQISEQQRLVNFEQINLEIIALVNSINILSEHASKLGNSISSTVNNYDKFAASFNRNIMSKVKNVENLGISSGNKKANMLERYQLVTARSDLIEAEPTNQNLSLLPDSSELEKQS